MIVGQSKIRSAVEESCRGSSLTQLRSRRFRWSTSSVVTSHGPIGVEPGTHFPLLHWPPDSSIWKVRSDRSLTTVKPAT